MAPAGNAILREAGELVGTVNKKNYIFMSITLSIQNISLSRQSCKIMRLFDDVLLQDFKFSTVEVTEPVHGGECNGRFEDHFFNALFKLKILSFSMLFESLFSQTSN